MPNLANTRRTERSFGRTNCEAEDRDRAGDVPFYLPCGLMLPRLRRRQEKRGSADREDRQRKGFRNRKDHIRSGCVISRDGGATLRCYKCGTRQ